MEKRKKKVLMFLQNGVGGAERMTILIGKLLDIEKYEVIYIPIKKKGKSTPIDTFIPKGYKTKTIDGSSTLKLIHCMINTINEFKPDIVFSSVLFINNKLLPLKLLFWRIKFIIRCENYLYTFTPKQRFFIKCFYHFANRIIAQTQEMKDELVEIGIKKTSIKVLQNPIDKEIIEQKLSEGTNPYPNDGKKHIVASGRFAYQKGFDLLVDAFNIVAQKRKDVELYIIGNKEGCCHNEYNRVFQKIKEYKLEDIVHCVGFQSNPYIYVKYADAFVLSSRWEGLPNVLIESLYLGTPAAAFNCIPVINRIIKTGESGYIAEKENIASLAEAIFLVMEMGRISTTYSSSSKKDFEKMFE